MVLNDTDIARIKQILDEELSLLSSAGKMTHPEKDSNWELLLEKSDEIVKRCEGPFVDFASALAVAGAQLIEKTAKLKGMI